MLVGKSYRIQAKCRKNIASFLQPTEHVDAVVCKQDRGETLIILRFDDWLQNIAINDAMKITMEEQL